MTRDSVQGFIDGYLSAGGDVSKVSDALVSWLKDHPQYPCSNENIALILDSLSSYSGIPK